MKEEIVYIMHVPWGWIKQRPHFMAEHLSEYFDVHVYYLYNLMKPFKGVSNESAVVTPHKLIVFPSRHINNMTIPLQLRTRMKKSKYVWLTHPALLRFVAPNLTDDHVVIYDCMDDAAEFPREAGDAGLLGKVVDAEKRLCERADLIFATSEYLRNKLIGRYGLAKPVTIVNNAIQLYGGRDCDIADLSPDIRRALSSGRIKLTYIGTVAEWMDFSLIEEVLGRYDTVEFLIFGHKDVEIPRHDRIKFFGPVKHEQIFPIMANSDVLVMPFILNELVLSVNPVKVYEYIHSGKPSLVRKYAETEKFADYVYLYSTAAEFCSLLEELMKNGLREKANAESCSEYVKNNTWGTRVREVMGKIAELA